MSNGKMEKKRKENVHSYLLKVVHSYLLKTVHCYLPFTLYHCGIEMMVVNIGC